MFNFSLLEQRQTPITEYAEHESHPSCRDKINTNYRTELDFTALCILRFWGFLLRKRAFSVNIGFYINPAVYCHQGAQCHPGSRGGSQRAEKGRAMFGFPAASPAVPARFLPGRREPGLEAMGIPDIPLPSVGEAPA